MKAVSGKDFCAILQQRGWVLKRIQGSHHIHGKSGHIELISVPVHGNRPLKFGLQTNFMRIAGIPEDEL